jgi:PTH1 family peptidyl-tRNA hydrolase
MFALIGLGNPGAEYAPTRHNIGFMVLDAVAEMFRVRYRRNQDDYLVAEQKVDGQVLTLVKPLTYMNNSGQAVLEVIQHYGININELLIIVDDFHLPLGTLRIRRRGSDGGHNGLRSVAHHLQTNEFARMRCGIGGKSMPVIKSDLADYVLSPFEDEEIRAVRILVENARDAAVEAARTDFEIAMQRFNINKINSPYF